ncbi:hypothetical protein BS50DRAFT_358184 [Corynespora cassiicola Philippines]|uniref:Uncharacterized protein n=1 Tax=Corynespora cassiicola Philippines TaxID=1448308 RepID=A0A2T2NRY1_CORCC|nr:hypothetical protein BS50DRAFT_358184 [Corynespora cassiicola Philippines]
MPWPLATRAIFFQLPRAAISSWPSPITRLSVARHANAPQHSWATTADNFRRVQLARLDRSEEMRTTLRNVLLRRAEEVEGHVPKGETVPPFSTRRLQPFRMLRQASDPATQHLAPWPPLACRWAFRHSHVPSSGMPDGQNLWYRTVGVLQLVSIVS